MKFKFNKLTPEHGVKMPKLHSDSVMKQLYILFQPYTLFLRNYFHHRGRGPRVAQIKKVVVLMAYFLLSDH